MRKLLNDEAGFIVSAELVLVLTIGVLAMVVGLAAVRDSVTSELNDVSNAIGAMSQSYNFSGLAKGRHGGGVHAATSGSGFNDRTDNCDCNSITSVDVAGKSDSSGGNPE